MKIKKSELLALIKEEIMSEMDGLTMMDDPYDDDAVPAGMEQGGAMDQVAEEIDRMITTEMDDVISMLSNFLVTSGASRDPRRAAAMGMDMLRDAGLTFPDQLVLEKMIKDEMDSGYYDTTYYADGEGVAPMPTDDRHLREGMENITPENIQLVMDALQKMAPLIGVMSLPVLIGMIYEQLKDMGAK